MPVALLDRIFVWLRRKAFFVRLTILTRILLAAGFIPTGMVKLLGQRFTTLPESNPIGAFFEAVYQTGVFWNFMGAAQVVAGALLLIPGLAHLGALAFLPVMACIVAIVTGVGFGAGTILVTVLMLLAVFYLLTWDYDRFRGLLTTRPFAGDHEVPVLKLDPWERVGFATFALALLTFFAFTRSFVRAEVARSAVWVALAAGVFTLLRFVAVSVRQGRGADGSQPTDSRREATSA